MASKNPIKISVKDKAKIYKLFQENNFTKQELAAHFNCSLSVVKNLIANFNSPLYYLRLQAKKAGTIEPISYAGEIWKEIKYPTKTNYEISTLGRVRSYYTNSDKPVIIRGVLQQGYLFLDYFNTDENRRIKVPFHILAGDHFIKKATPAHNHLIHLDYKKTNNRIKNLMWVTEVEMYYHHSQNKAANAAREKANASRTTGAKLTLVQVERIRKMLNDPLRKVTKTRIAAMYGIAPMTVYRIQSGEIWSTKGNHVTYKKKPMSLLDKATVTAIKQKLNQKNILQAEIAKEFGLTATIISRIKNGKTYKH